jgi:DNA-binding transcriptional LysR family regulator
MSITFKDLENFIITAESKTLSEASERLEMAQPSLSLGIKKLETEIGHPLFIRSRDGIKLTPKGKSLLPDAIEALNVLKKIKGENTAIKFRIGCHPSVGMFVLGDFLKHMHKENGAINFEIVNASSNEINKMVAQGSVDFGVVMNPLPITGLITKNIGDDDVHVWESKNRYDEKLIFNPQMIQAHSILSRWKTVPKDSIEVQNLELISHLTDSGAGLGILPSQVVKAQRLSLKIVPNTPSFKDHLGLVCYPEMIRSKEGKQIFEMLKKSFKG